jgi:hypothetical protein
LSGARCKFREYMIVLKAWEIGEFSSTQHWRYISGIRTVTKSAHDRKFGLDIKASPHNEYTGSPCP